MTKFLPVILTLAAAHAQAPATPAWDVASVKLNTSCGGGRGMAAPPSPGRINLQCNTVENLIRMAYVIFENGSTPNLKRVSITGGPGWTRSETYAINAKAEGPAPVAQMMGPMLRALLEDRFKLKVHHEAKEGPVYVLTLAKGGSKLQPLKEGSCIPLDLNHFPPPPAPGEPPPNICGNQQMRFNGKILSAKATGISVADWAGGMLAEMVGRPVIDKTGLEGKFTFEFEVAPDSSMAMFQNMGGRGARGDASSSGGPDTSPIPSAGDPDGPTIFMALEKLGLKLEAAKGPVDSLVIDHVEKPADN